MIHPETPLDRNAAMTLQQVNKQETREGESESKKMSWFSAKGSKAQDTV